MVGHDSLPNQQQQQDVCIVSDEEFNSLLRGSAADPEAATTAAAEEAECLVGAAGVGPAAIEEPASGMKFELGLPHDEDTVSMDFLDEEPLFETSDDLTPEVGDLETPETERMLEDLWLEVEMQKNMYLELD